MKVGVSMFATDYAIRPDDLAREAEARGFESVWFDSSVGNFPLTVLLDQTVDVTALSKDLIPAGGRQGG